LPIIGNSGKDGDFGERGLSETAGELAIPAAIIGNGGKIGYSGEANCRK